MSELKNKALLHLNVATNLSRNERASFYESALECSLIVLNHCHEWNESRVTFGWDSACDILIVILSSEGNDIQDAHWFPFLFFIRVLDCFKQTVDASEMWRFVLGLCFEMGSYFEIYFFLSEKNNLFSLTQQQILDTVWAIDTVQNEPESTLF